MATPAIREKHKAPIIWHEGHQTIAWSLRPCLRAEQSGATAKQQTVAVHRCNHKGLTAIPHPPKGGIAEASKGFNEYSPNRYILCACRTYAVCSAIAPRSRNAFVEARPMGRTLARGAPLAGKSRPGGPNPSKVIQLYTQTKRGLIHKYKLIGLMDAPRRYDACRLEAAAGHRPSKQRRALVMLSFPALTRGALRPTLISVPKAVGSPHLRIGGGARALAGLSTLRGASQRIVPLGIIF